MESILEKAFLEENLNTAAIPSLLKYAQLLVEKNEVMNLTSITKPDEIATLHFLDSLSVLNYLPLKNKKILDVGTGAGFPGMVLKLVEPECQMTLLDSLGKRIDWLKEVCNTLHLDNISCVHERSEDYAADHRETFDIVTSRAVANLNVLSELCLPLVNLGGTFVAMKSLDSDEEIASAKGAIEQLGGKVAKIIDYQIFSTDISHRLVIIEKIRPTPTQFPRSFAKIKKQPLK